MPVPQLDELTGIQSLLDPYLWVASMEWSLFGLHVTGYARPPETAESPAVMRGALYTRAEDAIASVEAAGYQHGKHPKFEIDGHAKRDHGTVSLEAVKLTLELWLRKPAEKAP